MALDRESDARPWIEQANAQHPSLVDEAHRLAELYNIINVPTMLWINEEGDICRPHDARFGTDTYVAMTGKPAAEYLDLVRAWVNADRGTMSAREVHNLQPPTTEQGEQARVHRRLAWVLQAAGHSDAAERHFQQADDLAPLDWTVRRGSLRLRGRDPFEEFPQLAAQGVPRYAIDQT